MLAKYRIPMYIRHQTRFPIYQGRHAVPRPDGFFSRTHIFPNLRSLICRWHPRLRMCYISGAERLMERDPCENRAF